MKRRTLTRTLPRLVLTGAIGTVLASCGGGSSNDDVGTGGTGGGSPTGNDLNVDGIPDVALDNFGNVDVDGDGVADVDENDDGIPDTDVNDDGVIDPSVLDGEGLLAGFDTTGDGEADVGVDGQPIATGPDFTPVSLENPCGSARGTDNASSNADWSDNCAISRTNQHAGSTYTAGIQRVVWCSSFAGDSSATTVDAFTDGSFGMNTQQAVEAFQQANSLTADGIVGPQTWAVMREALTDEAVELSEGGAVAFYGVEGARCELDRLFIAENSGTVAGNDISIDRWRLTQGENDRTPVAFGVESVPVD